MLKGYRTYLAILLTALVYGFQQIGIMPEGWSEWLIGILTAAGLWFRYKA